jgi:hypothetical protein
MPCTSIPSLSFSQPNFSCRGILVNVGSTDPITITTPIPWEPLTLRTYHLSVFHLHFDRSYSPSFHLLRFLFSNTTLLLNGELFAFPCALPRLYLSPQPWPHGALLVLLEESASNSSDSYSIAEIKSSQPYEAHTRPLYCGSWQRLRPNRALASCANAT